MDKDFRISKQDFNLDRKMINTQKNFFGKGNKNPFDSFLITASSGFDGMSDNNLLRKTLGILGRFKDGYKDDYSQSPYNNTNSNQYSEIKAKNTYNTNDMKTNENNDSAEQIRKNKEKSLGNNYTDTKRKGKRKFDLKNIKKEKVVVMDKAKMDSLHEISMRNKSLKNIS